MRFYLDNVLLSSDAYKILLLDSELRTPPVLGENVVIFNRSGRVWRKKKYDELRFTLAFYALGETTNELGEKIRDEETLVYRLDELKRLFSQEKAHELRVETGSISRRIGVEVQEAIAFHALDPALCRFVVELVAPYPFWLGAEKQYNVTLDASEKQITIVNNGSYRAENATLVVNGPTDGISFFIGSYSLVYPHTIEAGKTLTIQIRHHEAYYDFVDVSPLVLHSGDSVWLPIPTGTNVMTIVSSPFGPPPAPTATIYFDEHYL